MYENSCLRKRGRIFLIMAGTIGAMTMLQSCASQKENNTSNQNLNITLQAANDHALTLASEEARRRWPIFYKSILKKDKSGKKKFQVEIEVPANNRSEHLWVDVDSIKENAITGHFDSDGVIASAVHKGQPTTVETAEIADWAIEDGNKRQGSYTPPVIAKNSIAQLNNIVLTTPDHGASAKVQFLAHWQEIVKDLAKTGKLDATDADVQTLVIVQTLDSSIKGNSGKKPTLHELATICQLPDGAIGAMRSVYSHL